MVGHNMGVDEQEWPFVVKHNVPYGGTSWVEMCTWLDHNVGPLRSHWCWTETDRIRFKEDSHAVLFATGYVANYPHRLSSPREIMHEFPHTVYHNIKFNSEQWNHMHVWLNTHVGPYQVAWHWLYTNQLRFANESDVMLFTMAWI